MGYEVLARKWRPQQFDDVVGQQHVTQTLKNAINSDRIAHAFLFVGPRGIGKTSIARIFAKALNCQEGGPTATPCDACPSCLEIMKGNSLDVLEIDGASNNGVDQVRELRETVKFAPTRGKFKLYIIDEVHMLTSAAFNALLKTLEEPPPHVKFMFATTEPEKVLPTIISRCQRFNLRRIAIPLIAERLQMICDSEKIDADRDALLAVARGAEGGMRDAQSALDQLISFKGMEIHEEDVLSVFGLVSRGTLQQLAGSILQGDVPGLLSAVAGLDRSGKDLQRLVVELMECFRNLLVCMNVDDVGAALDMVAEEVTELRQLAGNSDTERVLRVTDILIETEERMRYALSKRILLETALIRASRAATVVSVDQLLKKMKTLGGQFGGVPSVATVEHDAARPASYVVSAPAVATPAAPPKVMQQKRPAPVAPPVSIAAPVAAPTPPSAPAVAIPEAASGSELAGLREGWKAALNAARRQVIGGGQTHVIQTFPLSLEADRLTLGCSAEARALFESTTGSRALAALTQWVATRLARPVELAWELMDQVPTLDPDVDLDKSLHEALEAAAAAPVAAEAVVAPVVTSGELHQRPEVRAVLDLFNGTIIDVKGAGQA